MQVASRVIKNTGFLYAKMGITMFISLYTTRLILNTLGAADFGIFNIVGGAIAMLGFLNVAMASATQRFMSFSEGEGNKEKQKCIFNISFVLHIIIAVFMAAVLLVAGYFFFNGILNIAPDRTNAAKTIYACLIISTLFTVMTVPYDAVLNAHENMLYYAIVGIFESLLKLAAALLVVWYGGDKLILYGTLMAFIPLITMTIMRLYCHKKYDECVISPKKYWNKDLLKEMTGFAGWSFLGSSSSMIGAYGLIVVLNMFFSTIVIAAQGIANQLNGQLLVFSNTMMKALNPAIVKSEGSGNRESMLKLALTGCKFSFFLFSFFSIPFLIETKSILQLWLKIVPEWTVLFCRLTITNTLIEQLTLSLGSSISAQGQIKNYTIIKSILNYIPLIFSFIIFKFGGEPYFIYIWLIVFWSIIGGIFTIHTSIKNCQLKLKDYLTIVLFKGMKVFIITFTVALMPALLLSESMLRLTLTIIISIVVFSTTLLFFGLSSTEKKMLISRLKQLNIYIY